MPIFYYVGNIAEIGIFDSGISTFFISRTTIYALKRIKVFKFAADFCKA